MALAEYRVKGNDNIRQLAHRLLGDFSRWQELVTINELDPPFIVADKVPFVTRGIKVLEPGDVLQYPHADAGKSIPKERFHPYGRDISMTDDGYLMFQVDDLVVTRDVETLRQGLHRRLNTALGNLPAHPNTYGHVMYQYIGAVADKAQLETLKLEARRALLADSRVASVKARATLQQNTGYIALDAFVTTQEQSLGVLSVTQIIANQ